MDRVMCYIMTWRFTLSVLSKVVKVEICGSGGYGFESTSHMPRNMVSGKPSTRMARQMDLSPPLDFYFMFTRTDVWEYVLHGRQKYGFCSRATDVCPAQLVCVRSYSRLWWPWSITRNMREMVAWNDLWMFPGVWVRFTLQGWIQFRNRPLLTMIETAYPFCHIE
jgi:hypothetical protein